MPRTINNNTTQRSTSSRIDPEILKAVAERVYTMLLSELKLDAERLGYRKRSTKGPGGGNR